MKCFISVFLKIGWIRRHFHTLEFRIINSRVRYMCHDLRTKSLVDDNGTHMTKTV